MYDKERDQEKDCERDEGQRDCALPFRSCTHPLCGWDSAFVLAHARMPARQLGRIRASPLPQRAPRPAPPVAGAVRHRLRRHRRRARARRLGRQRAAVGGVRPCMGGDGPARLLRRRRAAGYRRAVPLPVEAGSGPLPRRAQRHSRRLASSAGRAAGAGWCVPTSTRWATDSPARRHGRPEPARRPGPARLARLPQPPGEMTGRIASVRSRGARGLGVDADGGPDRPCETASARPGLGA